MRYRTQNKTANLNTEINDVCERRAPNGDAIGTIDNNQRLALIFSQEDHEQSDTGRLLLTA